MMGKLVNVIGIFRIIKSGAQFEGDLGEILALGAEISLYIGLRETHHRQALLSVKSHYILVLFYLMLIVCVLSYFVIKIS